MRIVDYFTDVILHARRFARQQGFRITWEVSLGVYSGVKIFDPQVSRDQIVSAAIESWTHTA